MKQDVAQPSRNSSVSPPDPEVKPKKAVRRHFSAREKLKILQETDLLTQGEIGAYLRRKGLYWSNLCTWRKQRDEGLLVVLEPKKRGCPPKSPEQNRLAKLERENSQLLEKLGRAETIIHVQKKLCELFGLTPAETEEFN